MTSQEFYRLVDQTLEPRCKKLGFSRKRGTISLWYAPLPAGTFFYEVSKGVKNKYIPPCGGRFCVHCDLTPSTDPKARGLQSSVSFMEYFSTADLEAMREIRDRVLHKIVGQRPTEAFDRMLLEDYAPILLNEIGRRFLPHQNCPLPYLDAEDVLAWSEFLALRLPQTLTGVCERPVFFMRRESAANSGSSVAATQ